MGIFVLTHHILTATLQLNVLSIICLFSIWLCCFCLNEGQPGRFYAQVEQQYSYQEIYINSQIIQDAGILNIISIASFHHFISYLVYCSSTIIHIISSSILLLNNYQPHLHNAQPINQHIFQLQNKNRTTRITLAPMKQVPYSPFNRSYKYMCLQNQLAHNKNKKSVKGLVDSNLSVYHDMFNASSTNNSSQFYQANDRKQRSVSQSINGSLRGNISGLTTRTLGDSRMGKLKQQPLTIHMNKRYNSRKQYQIGLQNQRIKRKLSQTKCRVVPYKQTQKHYSNTKEYKGIAMRYDKESKNKQLICFAQTSLTSTYAQSDPNTGRYLCRASSARKGKNGRNH